ncbi:hypothetical protein E2F43_15185 [Seongchinamella unica]|uniref:Uncharacterized protein n=1 Tax=Seongchinamella unica TaxID=2547392 RepID=A0A4R5LQP9_9GAMM|nr:hypothetical protein [Seongchinamella unica]TDG12897.1 hypothetical protein E2F43_15185 [Seongchinamella unica]
MAGAPRILFALPAIILAAWMAAGGARTFLLDLTYAATEVELSFWGRETYVPTDSTIGRVGSHLARLRQHQPRHPDYLALEAYYLSWRGFFSADMAERLDLNQQAVDTQYAALQQRPAYRQGWLEMIEYASRTSGGAGMLELAQSRIAALQPERD